MQNAKWRSRDARIALNIVGNGAASLYIIPLVDHVPFNFGLKLLSFIVLMIANAALVWLFVDHNFPAIEQTPAPEHEENDEAHTKPLAAENMPPLPTQKPSVGIAKVKTLQEYRERRHRKRILKEAYGAVLGLLCLLLGLVTSVSLQTLGSHGIANLAETNWKLIVVFVALWACYGWLSFETRVRKKIEPSDGKHPPHRFSRILSGGSYIVSVTWAIWVYLSMDGAPVGGSETAGIPITIGIVGGITTIASCLTLYREYWWHQRHWLIVSGFRVYMTYPKNKWFGFTGGEPEINVWQVLNCNELGQTLLEQWLFKDSYSVLINGPGEDDKQHFGNMTDVLHYPKLKETVDNNREVYNKRHELFNRYDD